MFFLLYVSFISHLPPAVLAFISIASNPFPSSTVRLKSQLIATEKNNGYI